MHEAVKRRRAKALDLTILIGGDGHKDAAPIDQNKDPSHGDLAPDVGAGMDDMDGSADKMAEERKAMHAKEAADLHGAVDHAGSQFDPEIDAAFQDGADHGPAPKHRSLASRVRSAISHRKGSK